MKKIGSFIMGIIIFSGMPIVGWGIKDITGFVQNPARLIYVIMMAVLTLLVVLIVPEEGRSHGEGRKLVKKHKLSLLYLQVIPLFIVIASPYFDRHELVVFPDNITFRIIGLIVTLIGFFIMNWSVMILGKQFSTDITIQDDHQLITAGPYRFIRHPRYLGIILFLSGISLVFISGISLILVFMTSLILVWRVRDEEQLMHQEFKDKWEKYKAQTKAFIPFIF